MTVLKIKHHRAAERIVEQVVFLSRWLLAPLYIGLGLSLLLLILTFGRKLVSLAAGSLSMDGADMIIGVLSLIDVALLANLVVVVMFAGYENFVSRLDLDDHRDVPDWIAHVGFSELKLKLLASIVAIAAITLLEDFMRVEAMDDMRLGWHVVIFMALVFAGVLMALMDRLGQSKPHQADPHWVDPHQVGQPATRPIVVAGMDDPKPAPRPDDTHSPDPGLLPDAGDAKPTGVPDTGRHESETAPTGS